MKTLNVLSLFSGIGGLDLGLQRAGMTIVGHVEIDPYCRRVLAKNFPGVPCHDDVKTALDWWHSEPRPHVDLVAGGFPCQPVSLAGRGKAQDDERWLWPQMLTIINTLRPEWVLFENVPGLRTRGLDIVTADLDNAGYTTTVKIHSACAVGAPHMRKRLLGVAHRNGQRCAQRPECDGQPEAGVEAPFGSDTVRRGELVPGNWPAEPAVGRVAHGVPSRVDRIRGLGNAVVPAVAEHIGRLIMAAAS